MQKRDDIDSAESHIEPIFERVEAYGKVQFELIKFKSMHKGVHVISSFISSIIVYAALTLFIVFASIALSIWLGEIIGHAYWGFGFVALFYGILALILQVFMRKSIKDAFSNALVKQFNS